MSGQTESQRRFETFTAEAEDDGAPDMNEWCDVIGDWAEHTFDHTNESIGRHLQLKSAKATEAARLVEDGAGTAADYLNLGHQVAGCFVLLATLCHRNAIDLNYEVFAEQRKNVNSQWAYDPATDLVRRVKAVAS